MKEEIVNGTKEIEALAALQVQATIFAHCWCSSLKSEIYLG